MRKLITFAVILGCVVLASPTLSHASYTQTKHPIVLVHGVTGFNTIGGLINYFHNIPWNLERSGARVYSASVSFVNSSEQRGQQLANYVNSLGHSKVNLMAHSQGAPTSRVTASLIPHKIASITSINGVNKGSKVADVVRGIIPPGSYVEGGADAIANALGDLINALSNSDNPQDGLAALETLGVSPGATVNVGILELLISTTTGSWACSTIPSNSAPLTLAIAMTSSFASS